MGPLALDRASISSSQSEMDAALATLQENKDRWANLTAGHRLEALDALLRDFAAVLDEWVALGLAAKGSAGDAYDAGWEWSSGPLAVIRYLNGLRRTLRHVDEHGQPFAPRPFMHRANGQLVTRIFSLELHERLTTPGVAVEAWMEPGVTSAEFGENPALAYRQSQKSGKVALVLGAGNVAGASVNDSLTKLFVESQVVVLKMNPINKYLGPLFAKGFAWLIDQGFLRVVYGGAAEGSYLCNHSLVDEIHLTGSARTYEAITFGVGEEGERRKKEHRLLLSKRFTANLGNVAPAIVVPGPWSASDIEYQAEQLASHLFDDGSYSCSRTRVILQHSAWPLRQRLLDNIRSVLRGVPSRPDFYPGAANLYQRFATAHPEMERFGSDDEGRLPWGFVPNLDARQASDVCFQTEAFCPIIGEAALDAPSTADFIDCAVEFANEHLWGTLSASIIIHPRSLQDPGVAAALERALDNLHYGVVNVNSIPGLAWATGTPPWGSYPGNEPWDIQSGTGFVHNAFMFARPQKVIVRAPFRTWPWPIWFPSRAKVFGRVIAEVVRYELRPSWLRLVKIIWAALRG